MAVNHIEDAELANFLKIVQIGTFLRQLNTTSPLWSEYWKPYIGAEFYGRQLQYLNVTSLGVAAVQAVPADSSGIYPESRKANSVLATANAKEWNWTVAVPRQILNKQAGLDSMYAETLTTELENKQIAFALLKSAELLGDGSGAFGRIHASTSPTVSSNQLVVTLSQTSGDAARSNIWWFQEEDEVVIHAEDSTDHNQYSTGNDASYWRIEAIDYDDWTLTLQAVNSSGTDVNAVSGQTNAATGDYIYRKGQSGAIPDLSSISGDYEDLSYAMVGLESLAADDGRQVHGLTKSGNLAGTRKDFNSATFSNALMQKLLARGFNRVGQNTYTYEKAFISEEAWNAIAEANEVDKRFELRDKGIRGWGMLGVDRMQHKIEYCADRFVHDTRVIVPPKDPAAKNWEDAPLSFVGSMPVQADPGGQGTPYQFGIASSGGRTGHSKEDTTYFEQQGVAIARHAAAIMIGENFNLPDLS